MCSVPWSRRCRIWQYHWSMKYSTHPIRKMWRSHSFAMNTSRKMGEIITDSCLLIGKKMYHIECQSTDDTTMAIRMIEYDFAIAVENAEKQGRRYRIEFPRSCVLFLRSSGNTPDYLEADVIFPDGKTHVYINPSYKNGRLYKGSHFEKNLLMLLPFILCGMRKRNMYA